MPAFHDLHLELNLQTNERDQRNKLQIHCHSAIASVTYNSGPPLAIIPSHSTQVCIRLVPGRTNSFFSMLRKFYRGESTGDNSASQEDRDD